jgi:4-amino-4-deoxy-L-arabinose transferase-like glycosyltransferase
MAGFEILDRSPSGKPVAESASEAGPASLRWWECIVPLVCCFLLALQLFSGIHHWSQTADESTHLYAGYRYLKCGDFGFGPEHPPLARIVAALPLLGSHIGVNCATTARDEAFASLDWLYAHDFQWTLTRARLAVSVFALSLCLLLWYAARRMFGPAAALVATLLLVFDPTVLAHGALVTTDMALTCTMFLSVFAFYLWSKRRTWPRLLLTGAATGLTMVAKQSGVLIFPILILLAVADALLQNAGIRHRQPHAPRSVLRNMILRNILRNAGVVVLIGIMAVGVIWTAYEFRFTAHADGAPLPALSASRGSFAGVLQALRHYRLLPEAYVQGLQTARVLARGQGSLTLLLNRVYPEPPWFYFPLNMAIKYTIPVMAMLILAIFGLYSGFRKQRREWLFAIVPPLFYLLTCLNAHINSGIRHVLPITPFLFLFVAAGCVHLARHLRWPAYVIALCVLLHMATSLHAYPHYLSYANEFWGGPDNTYRHLPNNDWGEALYAARGYVLQHPDEPCWLASPYLISIRYYQIPCRQFAGGDMPEPIPPHVHGIVILSSSFFDNAFYVRPGGQPNPENPWLAPFLARRPSARLGGSAMLAYMGDFDTAAAAANSEEDAARKLADGGRFGEALEHARRAAVFAPANSVAQFEYCRDLVADGQTDKALPECRIARALLMEGDAGNQSAAGIRLAIASAQKLHSGLPAEALREAQQAVTLAPGSSTAHREYCRALRTNGVELQAAKECQESLRLAKSYAPGFGWMGPVTNITKLGFTPGWGPARSHLADALLHALGEE